MRRSSGRLRGGERRTAGPLASPDFLLILLALTDFMRFSPTENRTRGSVQRSVAGNPGSLLMNNLPMGDGNELEAESFGLSL
jgi:hypothetical protein